MTEKFTFYKDWYDSIQKLDDATALEVCKAIMAVAFGEEPQDLSGAAYAMMLLIRPQIERDAEKKMEVRAKRQEVGRKGGLAKAGKNYQLVANGSNCYDVTTPVKVKRGFVKPTVEEVQTYIREKGFTFDAEAFYAFYESNGWKVGKNQMKNWRMACVTWEKSHKQNNRNYGRETVTEKIQRTVEAADEFSRRIKEGIGQQTELDFGDNSEVW